MKFLSKKKSDLPLPEVMICTPCKNGTVDINYAFSLTASCQSLTKAGIEYQTAYTFTSSIDNGRNVLASLFLKSSCTHFLFIDDDMAWASDLPLRLLNENVDIVGVPYRKKQGSYEYTTIHEKEVASIEGRPWMMMVEGLGMGMTLISRNVFEKMRMNGAQPYHCYGSDEPQYLFFRHDLYFDKKDNKMKYESEDFRFCRVAREQGFEVWAYVDEDVPHIGRMAFRGAYNKHIAEGTKHGFTSDRKRNKPNVIGIEVESI